MNKPRSGTYAENDNRPNVSAISRRAGGSLQEAHKPRQQIARADMHVIDVRFLGRYWG
jgi:hypothetical protein